MTATDSLEDLDQRGVVVTPGDGRASAGEIPTSRAPEQIREQYRRLMELLPQLPRLMEQAARLAARVPRLTEQHREVLVAVADAVADNSLYRLLAGRPKTSPAVREYVVNRLVATGLPAQAVWAAAADLAERTIPLDEVEHHFDRSVAKATRVDLGLPADPYEPKHYASLERMHGRDPEAEDPESAREPVWYKNARYNPEMPAVHASPEEKLVAAEDRRDTAKAMALHRMTARVLARRLRKRRAFRRLEVLRELTRSSSRLPDAWTKWLTNHEEHARRVGMAPSTFSEHVAGIAAEYEAVFAELSARQAAS